MSCFHALVFIDSTTKDIFLFGKIISFKENSKILGSLIRRSAGNLKIRLPELQKTCSSEKAFIFASIKCDKINKPLPKYMNFENRFWRFCTFQQTLLLLKTMLNQINSGKYYNSTPGVFIVNLCHTLV